MVTVRLTHIDGKLPNLALMKLSHWHKAQGDIVYFTKHVNRDLFEPEHDVVYGSCIFTFSAKRLQQFLAEWPNAIVGGTGTNDLTKTVENVIGSTYEHYDYSIYPYYPWSLGFTSRGCRMRCKFCVVPDKEGRPQAVNTIYDIWREGTPRCVVLLDNDFFGQAHWLERYG